MFDLRWIYNLFKISLVMGDLKLELVVGANSES
jgi:hypothetical protein